jgi:G protein beta subunit-like protein
MWVWDAAFSNDGKFIITASTDGTAKLWNTETGRIDRNFSEAHNKGITALALADMYVN